MNVSDYRALVDQDIAYLESLPPCPERVAQVTALRLSADLYSPPFSLAYEHLVGTDASCVNSGTSSIYESSPTGDDSQVSTVHEIQAVDE